MKFSSVQSLSCVQLFATPWTAACQASLSITSSRSLLKFMCIESVMPSNHLILCCHLLLPSVFPSMRVFSSESVVYNQLLHQSFQWIFRTDFLQDGLVGSPCSPRDSCEHLIEQEKLGRSLWGAQGNQCPQPQAFFSLSISSAYPWAWPW